MHAGDAPTAAGPARRAARLRGPEDKSDPVELLLDITVVSLLNQASGLLPHDGGPGGTLRALAVLLVAVLFWQMTAAATGIVPLDGVLRALYLAETGAFLLMAASVHEAFEPGRGPLAGPALFAGATALAGVCSVGMWVHVGAADRRWRGNAALLIGFAVVMSVFAWLAALHAGSGESAWLLTGYGLSIALCSNTAIPYPRALGIGSLVDGWAINGARAYRERYTTAYIVGCCLSLELLEMAAARRFGGPRLPVALAVLLAAFAVSCLLYWLYEPLVDPARRAVDPRNAALSHSRKVAHSLGDVYGHILMFCGLVLVAGALRSCFTAVLDGTVLDGTVPDAGRIAGGALGPAVDTRTVAGLCGGIALCLAGQAFFSLVTVWRPDPLRIGGACGAAALIPALRDRPVVVVVLVPVVLSACVYALDRRRAAAGGRRGLRRSLRDWRNRLPRRVPRVDSHHAVSGFELFFDFLAAFAFAQVGNLLVRDPGLSGAARTLLVLGCVYGCWISYCAAANAARADLGPLRRLHVGAVLGLVLLGLAAPGAFASGHVGAYLGVFLASYAVIRLGSAASLWWLFGRTAVRRAVFVAGCGLGAAASIAAAVAVGAAGGLPFWICAAVCEAAAVTAVVRGHRAPIAGHLAERFAFLVILGLDLSLTGVCTRFAEAPIGPVHIAVMGLALVICTLMWWLYFDTLTHYAEHRLHHAGPRAGRRLLHLHYNGLHLIVVAGMVAFGIGLRAIAQEVAQNPDPLWGPPLSVPDAATLAAGLAAYLAGIFTMWSGLRRHAVTPWLAAGGAAAAIPVLAGLPAAEALAALAAVAGLPVIAHAVTPSARAHRRHVHAELRRQPKKTHTPEPKPALYPQQPRYDDHMSALDV